MRILLPVLLLAACSAPDVAPAPVSDCIEQRFENAGFIVCSAVRIEVRSGMRDFKTLQSRLGERSDEVSFAMNGGMFDEAGAPIGLLIEDGRQVHAINRRDGSGNFHLSPNGVFLIHQDGRTEVKTSARWAPAPNIAFATQSGPMLVINGKIHPKFDGDGSSRYIRNAVGIGPDGKPLFVITSDVVSFGKLARFFSDRLKSRNALYLDGSVSSLWDPANGRMDDFVDIGPMIVAFKANAGSKPDHEAHAKP